MCICLLRPHWWRCTCTPPNLHDSGCGSCARSRLCVCQTRRRWADCLRDATRTATPERGELAAPCRSSPPASPGPDGPPCPQAPLWEDLNGRREKEKNSIIFERDKNKKKGMNGRYGWGRTSWYNCWNEQGKECFIDKDTESFHTNFHVDVIM